MLSGEIALKNNHYYYYYVTSHLQRIQNYAVRVILRFPMSSSITTHLKSLHWLPVKVRNHLQNSLFVLPLPQQYCSIICHWHAAYKAIAHPQPSLQLMHHVNRPAHSRATLGDRSFSFASSSVWNSIPNDVRCSPSLSSFMSHLKTYLFSLVYKD